jgi:hypothetical protein
MGVAVGDIDNDGRPDLYLTKFNAPNQLLRNNGNGTFTDISKASGTDSAPGACRPLSWTSIATAGSDLYVGHYLRYTLEGNTRCMSPSGAPDYCTPDSYQPLPGSSLSQPARRHVRDVSAPLADSRAFGPALGVSTADFNGRLDGRLRGQRRQGEPALDQPSRRHVPRTRRCWPAWRCRSPARPRPAWAWMPGDADDDGDDDLVDDRAHRRGSNRVRERRLRHLFEDHSTRTGIGPASTGFTGFGAALVRLRQRRPARSAGGQRRVQVIEALRQAGDPFPVHQRKRCSTTPAAAASTK